MATTRTITRYRSRPKSRRHSKAAMTIPLAALAGFVPLAARALDGYKGNGLYGAMDGVLSGLTGFSSFDRKWHADIVLQNVGPIVGGILVHKLASKLGINRALSQAGVPFLRV